ncbi:Hexose carrier protein HEX6 [Dichanthelium oligosanthes]|uniref:Hexose carrier protein HEX6 n=1 Tax=Dichanthelium oligosanthes TaxID=888268 RepID=A0A1E5V8G4_9POAL|nr:Hexose carrier protein HEX6 [Dichanthelium oligosanthes]
MAPARFRGAFSNGGGWGWRVSVVLAAVTAGLLTLGALLLQETPNNLVQQGKDRRDVEPLLQKIRDADVDIGHELDDIVAANAAAAAGEGDGLPRILFERRYRPQLVIAVMIPFFQQVTGINAIAFYAPVLLRTIGMGESAALLSAVAVTGVVGVVSTFASMLTVDRFGRRTLFLVGGLQMLATQVLIGAIMAAKLHDDPASGGVSKAWAVLILLIAVYVAGFGLSWGPLGWLVPSEIFPLEVRAAGQALRWR